MKTKRIFACLTVLVLLAVSLPLSSLAETYATVISWDVLHLRSGPGSDYAVIGKYRRGTKVEVLSSSYRNWVRVRTPDRKTGYMYKQLCQIRHRPGQLPQKRVRQFHPAGPAVGRNNGNGALLRRHLEQGPLQRDGRIYQDQVPDQDQKVILGWFIHKQTQLPGRNAPAVSVFALQEAPAARSFPGH